MSKIEEYVLSNAEVSGQLLTRAQVARELQVSVGTLADWAWKGIGPRYVKFRNIARYPRSELEAWKSKCLTPTWDPATGEGE